MAFLALEQVRALGLARVGTGVLISDKASFHNPGCISIGERSRIDDFCILSAGEGGIQIGRNVHIACMVTIIGRETVIIKDFANLSGRVSVYTSSDDFTGAAMTNPTVPPGFTAVTSAPVTIGRHAIIGAGSVILPGVTIGEGAAIGALSLVKSDCEAFVCYGGIPAAVLGTRKRDLLMHAARYEESIKVDE